MLADHLADLCCAPTETSRQQLAAEGIAGARVVVTGNTVVDAARAHAARRRATRRRCSTATALSRDAFVLSTFHRPENVDDDAPAARSSSRSWARCRCPSCCRCTRARAARLEASGSDALGLGAGRRAHRLPGVPRARRERAFLVSDSGGVQEEASIVKRPVLVVRRSTERPEVIGTFAELVPPGRVDRRARPGVGRRSRPAPRGWPPTRRAPTATATRVSASSPRSPSAPGLNRPEPGRSADRSPRLKVTAPRYHRPHHSDSVLTPQPAPRPDGERGHDRPGRREPVARARSGAVLHLRDPATRSPSASARTSSTGPRRTASSTVRCDTCGLVYLDPRPVRAEMRDDLPRPLPRVHVHRGQLRVRLPGPPPARGPPPPRRVRHAARRTPRSSTSAAATGSTSTCCASSANRAGSSKAWTSTAAPPTPPKRAACSSTAARSRSSTSTRTATTSRSSSRRSSTSADPAAVLRAIRRVLRPGGRLLIVTDNTGSLDFSIAKRRHWGGYHFPRHWYLFDAAVAAEARRARPGSRSTSSTRWSAR